MKYLKGSLEFVAEIIKDLILAELSFLVRTIIVFVVILCLALWVTAFLLLGTWITTLLAIALYFFFLAVAIFHVDLNPRIQKKKEDKLEELSNAMVLALLLTILPLPGLFILRL